MANPRLLVCVFVLHALFLNRLCTHVTLGRPLARSTPLPDPKSWDFFFPGTATRMKKQKIVCVFFSATLTTDVESERPLVGWENCVLTTFTRIGRAAVVRRE